ncbi:MAG: uracil-DNA glycosylase [Weeksellaceae bacterium]|nr:uracil-DNA glycosylase [Weeksellaceae bacterium]
MIKELPTPWQSFLQEYLQTSEFLQLQKSIAQAYGAELCYPTPDNIYRALELTAPQEVKVIILGQDPYHTPQHATGLAFSAPQDTKIPPSLRNIFKELHNDLGVQRTQTDLTDWAQQGILLLNTSLSVAAGKAASHKSLGWAGFTNHIIQELSRDHRPKIFVLWGKHAQSKLPLIDQSTHIVFQSAHPSPLSAHQGFFGSQIFSRINTQLSELEQKPIHW